MRKFGNTICRKGMDAMRKKILTMVAAGAMTMAMSVTAFAAGWVQNDTGWWYGTNADNTAWYSNGWQWIDDNGDGVAECYYFDGNGYIAVNGTTPDGYQVDSNGAWIIDGQIQTKSADVSSTGYTHKISNEVWELMNNTYEQNKAKYGGSTAPYELTYYNFFPGMTEEESLQAKPYILEFDSSNGPLTRVFEDAPQVSADTSLNDVAAYLENLGYTVEWGRTELNTNDACWITVNKFEVAFIKHNNSFDIRVRQDIGENKMRILGAMSMPAAATVD